MIYFAYGSNMSSRRLTRRAPEALQIDTGYIEGYSLRTHKIGKDNSGKCDALFTGNLSDRVYGVLYEITRKDRTALDLTEGLGHGYTDKAVRVINSQDKPQEAFTYLALLTNSELNPFHWYKEHVIQGAREGGLPSQYIAMVESIDSIPDPDRERAEREFSMYR